VAAGTSGAAAGREPGPRRWQRAQDDCGASGCSAFTSSSVPGRC